MRPLVISLTLRWFAVGGGLSAYAVALVGGFWLVPVACVTTGVWVLHALMAACLLVAGASSAVAWLLWKGGPGPEAPSPPQPARGFADRLHLLGVLGSSMRLAVVGLLWSATRSEPPRPPPPDRPRREREQVMALVGIVLGVLSLVLVAFHWAPVFVLDPCR